MTLGRQLRGRVGSLDNLRRQEVCPVAAGRGTEPESRHGGIAVDFDADGPVSIGDPNPDRLTLIVHSVNEIALLVDPSNDRMREAISHRAAFQSGARYPGSPSSLKYSDSATSSWASVHKCNTRMTDSLKPRDKSSRRRSTCARLADSWHNVRISWASCSGAALSSRRSSFTAVGRPRSVVCTTMPPLFDRIDCVILSSPFKYSKSIVRVLCTMIFNRTVDEYRSRDVMLIDANRIAHTA